MQGLWVWVVACDGGSKLLSLYMAKHNGVLPGLRLIPRALLSLGLLCLAVDSPALLAAEVQQPQILVFAAASLTDAMQELGAGYQKTARVEVKLSFDASSSLAREIEAGARADVFFSADTDWMDYLQKRNVIQPATRKNLLGNSLVLIAPAQSQIKLKIAPHFPLAAALGKGRLATGDPDSVPVGRYARAALTTLGVWGEVAPHLVRAGNVRDALMYVGRGEAPLGIVYSSDALVDKAVRVVDTFPADTHQPIVYPIALTQSAGSEAAAFVAYLEGPQGQKIFIKYGFAVLAR
jgi:molybdate transport system substrate-binding protein